MFGFQQPLTGNAYERVRPVYRLGEAAPRSPKIRKRRQLFLMLVEAGSSGINRAGAVNEDDVPQSLRDKKLRDRRAGGAGLRSPKSKQRTTPRSGMSEVARTCSASMNVG